MTRIVRIPILITLALGIPSLLASNAPAFAATGPTARASSVHSDPYHPQFAVDGKPDTRWASKNFKDEPQWLELDLGSPKPIEAVLIKWERAFATDYQIQISNDAKTWETTYEKKDGKGDQELITGLKGKARYVRVLCLKPSKHNLVSIWEISLPSRKTVEAALNAGRQAEEARQRAAEGARKLAAVKQDLGFDEIVFAVRNPGVDGHWYANFGYYARDVDRKVYGAGGGKLCRLNVKTGQLVTMLEDSQGAFRDPQVHYDGKKIIFSWRKGGTDFYNLYEINADGSNLRQLTAGPWDDIEPAYLPDGGIVFVSSRCKRWVNCWLTQVAVLYRCDADGTNIRPLSSNNEQDNTPWVLSDGRILYQRWEYVDRSQVDYHHLWTMNPDGTGQMVFYGNMHPSLLMIDAKPIPGTGQILSTFSPGHGRREHEGAFYVLDSVGGPDDKSRATPAGGLAGRDPYPLSDQHLLYAHARSIRLADYDGAFCDLYTDPSIHVHEPRPIRPRKREPIIAPRSNPQAQTGRVVLADVHIGRNMQGVQRGQIKKLLVLETLPKSINYTGGMDPLTYGGSFTLERVIGTVPVEPDGSAYIEVPALRSLFFVALDENDLSVKRMQSFFTVQPGETLGCIGCHEQRTQTMIPTRDLLAFKKPPRQIEPVPGIPDVLDFPRDIQPILDRHCVSCHGYEANEKGPRAGGLLLSGDRGPMFSHSYASLTVRKSFADGRDQAASNYAPRTLGTSGSPMMKKILKGHKGVKLSPHEINLVRYWIETGAPYPGTYAALGSGMIGGYDQNKLVETDDDWPQTKPAADAINQRCTSCHQNETSIPKTLCDENGLSFWRPKWDDPRLFRVRHLVFNLSRPEKSLMLLAPLAKEAGGWGICAKQTPIFANTSDPDYQKILALVEAGKKRLEEIKRFDMPGFRPDPAYFREMKRYGILPADFDPEKHPFNCYEIDQKYWRSLWWQPQ